MENKHKIRGLLSSLQSSKDELRDFLEDNCKDLEVVWHAIGDTKDSPYYQEYLLRYKELLIKSSWNFADPIWDDEILSDLAKEIPDNLRKSLNQWVEKCSRIRYISLELMFFGCQK